MAAVKIRDLTLDDLPAIVEIYNSTVSSRMVTADPKPVSVERDLIVLVLSLDGTG
jgi:L-amino acid N-acyltransferase YncA